MDKEEGVSREYTIEFEWLEEIKKGKKASERL